MNKRWAIMLLIVAVIIAIPLIFESKTLANSESSDDQGPTWILQTGYVPWIHSLWTPPNSDIEAGLFAMQAAIGAGIMGYVFGIFHEQSKARKREEEKRNLELKK